MFLQCGVGFPAHCYTISLPAFFPYFPSGSMSLPILILITTGAALFLPSHAVAQDTVIRPAESVSKAIPVKPAAEMSPEMSLARNFVSRISAGFKRADTMMAAQNGTSAEEQQNVLDDGEILMFRARLESRIVLDAPIMAQIENGNVLFSLRDFAGALELPITLNETYDGASGWYIRENKPFTLNLATREAISDYGTFALSSAVISRDEDIWVPLDDLAMWFGFKMTAKPSAQDLLIASNTPFPFEERRAREGRNLDDNKIGPAQLPRGDEGQKSIAFPFVDVATRSGYSRDGDSDDNQTNTNHSASIQTTGDFGYGTLTTLTQLNDEDYLSSLRLNYSRESLEPGLLGPLHARRYEIGDLSTVNLPMGQSQQEFGARITNIHPLRAYLRPSTTITGSAFPGWDVELYREGQLLSFQKVGDNGIYNFDNIDLFSQDNSFRVVMYGPQGEVKEEEIYIPVDTQRSSQMGSAYDLSVTSQDSQTYRAYDSLDNDQGALRVSGLFEKPFGDSSAASIGFETEQRDDSRILTMQGGLSTTIAQTLLNLNTAVEDNGEMAAELVARRNFGQHEIRNELNWATNQFDSDQNTQSREVFSEQFNINGPLGLNIGTKPRYNLGANYIVDSNDNTSTSLLAGINTSWRRFAFGQQFDYDINDASPDDHLNSITTLNGSMGLNRFRLMSNYQVLPENKLESITASAQRYINKDVELGLDLLHRPDPRLTEGRTYLNWNAGFARISPQITYNSDHDISATLNTRFGIARDPQQNKIKMFDRPITAYGGLSAFVFLDKNGDDIFNGEDEALPDIAIQAPQNGGRVITKENGYAFFTNMNDMRITDIYVDPDSLPDPLWIPGFAGMSVLPREGHVTEIQFPVHLAGEIDGNISIQDEAGNTRPMRGAEISLYNIEGKKAQSTFSESDGFYLLSRIPPGLYTLIVEGKGLQGKDMAAPPPQTINIGYNGETISGNAIILESGRNNVAVSFLSQDDTARLNPALLYGRKTLLNLGAYKSQMLMGVTWFKLKTRHPSALAGATLLEKPSESYAGAKTGTAALRVGLRDDSIEHATKRCAILLQDGSFCSVEILPESVAAPAPLKTAQQD